MSSKHSKSSSKKTIMTKNDLAKTMDTIVVYTDGSCANNGRNDAIGGIGIHFPNKELADVSKVFRKGICTNQKTELYAIYYAIKYIKKKFDLEKYDLCIITDSEYSINALTKWVYGWEKNGWVTASGTEVKNLEWIQPIYRYCRKYTITFQHVLSHTGNSDPDSKGNAKADKLATAATEKARREMKPSNAVEDCITRSKRQGKISKPGKPSKPTKPSHFNSRFKTQSNPSYGSEKVVVELIQKKVKSKK